jgi:hypothetical protein
MITYRKLGQLGRWGNQLFQYSGVYLYATTNHFTYAMPSWTGADVFKSIPSWSAQEKKQALSLPTTTLNDYTTLSRTERLLSLLGKKPIRLSIQDLYQRPQDNIDLFGYFQDPFSIDLLKSNRRDLINLFQFKEEIHEAFLAATHGHPSWTGVHIRRGDFVKRDLHMPIEPYVQYLREHHIKNIYVSSDDPTIMEQLKEFSPLVINNPLPQVPNFIFDFWMLMNAEMILGCGSTFSWWAALLSQSGRYISPPLTHLRNKEGNWKNLHDESFF